MNEDTVLTVVGVMIGFGLATAMCFGIMTPNIVECSQKCSPYQCDVPVNDKYAICKNSDGGVELK